MAEVAARRGGSNGARGGARRGDGRTETGNSEICGGIALTLLRSCRPLRSQCARYRNYSGSFLNAPRSLSTSCVSVSLPIPSKLISSAYSQRSRSNQARSTQMVSRPSLHTLLLS